MKYLIIVATLLCLASTAYAQPMYCGYKRVIRLGYTTKQVSLFCGGPAERFGDGDLEIWVYLRREAASTYGASYSIYLYFERGVLISIERG